MERFNVFLPVLLVKWFRAHAKREGMTVSEAMRLALREYKGKQERK